MPINGYEDALGVAFDLIERGNETEKTTWLGSKEVTDFLNEKRLERASQGKAHGQETNGTDRD